MDPPRRAGSDVFTSSLLRGALLGLNSDIAASRLALAAPGP